jgi:hypothetical protein
VIIRVHPWQKETATVQGRATRGGVTEKHGRFSGDDWFVGNPPPLIEFFASPAGISMFLYAIFLLSMRGVAGFYHSDSLVVMTIPAS